MKIFPFNNNESVKKTWHNYSNYLNWLYSDIQSIEDYLQMFNPDFSIVNESLHVIQSKNWKYGTIAELENWRTNYLDNSNNLLAYKLKFRQGYYASGQIGVKLNENSTSADITLASGQVLFATRKNWTDSSYIVMSQPLAALYLPQNIENGLKYTIIPNGQSVVGTNIIFSLEFFPCRYFLKDQGDQTWGPIEDWNATGAYWSTQDDQNPRFHILSTNKNVWNDSFPLMHKTYLKTGNKTFARMEEFIFDQSFNSEKINIANHFTAGYNINTDLNMGENGKDNPNMFDEVYVSII